ncbi:hypothetical protein [Dongia sp.]|uniref:hypothetical protein n=1 Tax=Dongia sp. TaxID=1977262 RepID=UPI003752716C
MSANSAFERLPIPMNIYGTLKVPSPTLRTRFRKQAYLTRVAAESLLGMIEWRGRRIAAGIDWSPWKPGRPTVLCLKRATFIKDVQVARASTEINLVSIPATRIKKVQEKWIPKEWRIQSYFTDLLDRDLVAFRPYLQRFAETVLKEAQKVHPVDAVMAGNTDYWQDEAMRLGCEALGIPFLVLCRENYTIPQDRANVLAHYTKANFRFKGTGVAVYSEISKATMERMGAYAPGSIHVTGAPRFDQWLGLKTLPLEERNCVTLISYAYRIYEAMENFRDVAEVFTELAAREPKLRFVLKLKKANEDVDAYALYPELKDSKVEFTADWSLVDLYPKSRVIVGCNSLAVAEALLSNAAVIVPAWKDALNNPGVCLYHYDVPEHVKCIYFPRSVEEFRGLMERAIAGNLPPLGTPEERLARFNEHIAFTPDKSAASKVEAFIRHFTKK